MFYMNFYFVYCQTAPKRDREGLGVLEEYLSAFLGSLRMQIVVIVSEELAIV
jgi:hypothetical protein